MTFPTARQPIAIDRRTAARFLAAPLLAGLLGSAAAADWAPRAPVRLVVPFSPGGAADVLARLVEPGLRERLRQAVLVENRVGATGSIGADHVYSAPPDGLVLLVGNADGLSMYPHIVKTRFVPTRLVPVAPLGSTPFVLMGRADLPAADLKALLALARSRPLSYASAGTGSSMHVLSVALRDGAKIGEMVHVPYQGASPGLQALVAGQVDLMMVPAAIAGPYRSRLKAYGITTASRFDYFKDIPTLAEQGLSVVGESWLGVLAPPGTPADVVATLAGALREITTSADYRERLGQMGLATLDLGQPEFARYYLEAYRKWGDVIVAGNIKAD
jgi:tripartite-type tricarboxylate transporter receptor subunit TctC